MSKSTIICLMGLVTSTFTFAQVDLVPLPQHVSFSGAQVALGAGAWSVVLPAKSDSLTSYAAERVQELFLSHGLTKPQIITSVPSQRAILIGTITNAPQELVAAIKGLVAQGDSLQPQGYSLAFSANDQKVFILGQDPLGALYGVTTLEQLTLATGPATQFVDAVIRDWPHFKNRVLGEMCGLAHKVTFEEYQKAFTNHLQNFCIPNRINVIDMRHGAGSVVFHDTDGLRTNTEENRKRLRWATTQARKHGVEIEYRDDGAVSWDGNLLNTAPYKELIWNGKCFFCYSRENLIRKTAGDMGKWMADVGLRVVYLHLQDANNQYMDGKWNNRCSECRKQWPKDSDVPHAQFGDAQANLGNIYYDELNKHVPDLVLNMVPTLYTAGYPEYQKALHAALHPNINLVSRELAQNTVHDLRKWYGNGSRGVFWYNQDDWKALYLISLRSLNPVRYYIGNDRDSYYGKVLNGASLLMRGHHAYYAWNVKAPGNNANSSLPTLNVCKVVDELERPGSVARQSLDLVAKHTLGSKWGPKTIQLSLTWLVPGFFSGSLSGTRLKNVMATFPQLNNVSDADKRLEFIKIQFDEAKRMMAVAEPLFTEPDVPYAPHEFDLHGMYAAILMCRIISEPMYWEEVTKRTKKKEDYQKAYQVTRDMMAEFVHGLGTIPSNSTRWYGLTENSDLDAKLELYLTTFAKMAGLTAYFRNASAIKTVTLGYDFGYRIRYTVSSGNGSLKILKKPSWIKMVGDSVYGTPSVLGFDTVEAALLVDGKATDTMQLHIHVQPFITYMGNSGPQTAMALLPGVAGIGMQILSGHGEIIFSLQGQAGIPVSLDVFNSLGQRVWYRRIHDPRANHYRVSWLGQDAWGKPVGHVPFVVRFQQGRHTSVKRFVAVR